MYSMLTASLSTVRKHFEIFLLVFNFQQFLFSTKQTVHKVHCEGHLNSRQLFVGMIYICYNDF